MAKFNEVTFERQIRATGNTADNAVENFIRLAAYEKRWKIDGTVTLNHRSAADVAYDEKWLAEGILARIELL